MMRMSGLAARANLKEFSSPDRLTTGVDQSFADLNEIQHVDIRLVSKREIAKNVNFLWFRTSDGSEAKFRPGQFAMVETPGDQLLPRPLSYCDCSYLGDFAFLVETRGNGTRDIVGMAEGEEVRCLGPLGTSFTPPRPEETAVVVGAGVDLAPFASFMRLQAAQGRNSVVLADGRSRLVDLLSWPCADVRRVRADKAVEMLPEVLGSLDRPRLYSGGPERLFRRLSEISAEMHVPCEVMVKRRMACGVGCCFGCAVKAQPESGGEMEFVRSCREGPVMNLNRLDVADLESYGA